MDTGYPPGTFGDTAERYIRTECKALTRRRDVESVIRRRLLPAWDQLAIALLRRHLGSLALAGARFAADRNVWLASPLGLAKPAALAQAPIAAGDLRNLGAREARIGVVALAGTQVVEARLVALGLTRALAPLGEAVVVASDLYRQRGDALRTLPEIARDLDQPGRRAALAESLGRAAAQAHATHLLMPTLGMELPIFPSDSNWTRSA